MSINVELSAFQKRLNSTKRPSNYRTFSGELKHGTSVLSPRITFNIDGNPSLYNYAHVASFNRYYWIDDWSFQGGLWTATMRVDPLASWRNAIGQTEAYVLRSASKHNALFADTLYPPQLLIKQQSASNIKSDGYNWSGDLQSGRYVVGIINGSDSATGSVAYYVFTQSQFRNLCSKLLSDPATYLKIDAAEISENLQKAVFNPFQYVASCMWFPFDVAHKSTISKIKFGWWEMSCSCSPIAEHGYSLNELQFVVPQHPQSGERGLYMCGSPYTSLALFIPGFGEMQLQSNLFVGNPLLSCEIVTDSITGIGTLRLYRTGSGGQTGVVSYHTAQIGVPITISGLTTPSGRDGLITGALMQTGGALASMPDLSLPVVGDSINYLKSAVSLGLQAGAASMMSSSSLGNNGNVSIYHYQPQLRARFMSVGPEDIGMYGRPLCETVHLSTLSGFIQCMSGTFDGGASISETQTINNYLTSGFYFE